jgi:hypothetical protein
MGQSRRLSDIGMSASPPTTDVSLDAANRRFGPIGDIAPPHSITSSVVATYFCGRSSHIVHALRAAIEEITSAGPRPAASSFPTSRLATRGGPPILARCRAAAAFGPSSAQGFVVTRMGDRALTEMAGRRAVTQVERAKVVEIEMLLRNARLQWRARQQLLMMRSSCAPSAPGPSSRGVARHKSKPRFAAR